MMGSFDPDHALAILLQARFNEEAKKQKDKGTLSIPQNKPQAGKSSLIDPEWEVTDPCPDIHGLFLAFNERFFWGRLMGIEVKWSPQMTSCAGICVYEGNNGLCSVRLSAPLLKLRPRSDLIETLLHEMIHAFLFVTKNNRDRDGHGPEFHKHMYRINKEAGTNITVYHSFHAEVKVYQQHWWRCSGPCQYRPPFFGMVKRAKNRAPGPNDLWWSNHQAACGGQFIKVREPEGYSNKKRGKEAKPKYGKDIRNFFKTPAAASSPIANNKVGNNIFGFNNFDSNSVPSTAVKHPTEGSSLNRVVGFSDLTSPSGSSVRRGKPATAIGKGHVLGRGKGETPERKGTSTSSGSGRGIGRGGMLANRGGGTLVVTGSQGRNKPLEKPESPDTRMRVNKFRVFSGSGHTLGSSSNNIDISRSRLLSIGQEPESKKQKIDDENTQQQSINGEGSQLFKNEQSVEICQCLICNERIPRAEMDVHLESCAGLQNIFEDSSTVDVADEKEINDINNKYKVTSCPVCALHIEGDINAHLDECLNTSGILNMFDETPTTISDSESPVMICSNNVPKPITVEDNDVEIIEPEDRVACPICGMRFGESRINGHVNQCLDSDDSM